jgi:hypothetical protein
MSRRKTGGITIRDIARDGCLADSGIRRVAR